jgi:hypothetical protein
LLIADLLAQICPGVPLAQLRGLEGLAVQREAESVHAAGAGQVGPHLDAGQLQALGELDGRRSVPLGLVNDPLEALSGRLLAGGQGYLYFSLGGSAAHLFGLLLDL